MTEEISEIQETILAVRIPSDQREKIKSAASIEERTESGFARYHLLRIADQIIFENQPTEQLTGHVTALTVEGES